ncbi:hypothetical protein MMC25_007837 [Agyrium rufum]|nr:hypothetical protein [Agyrium rufum]
MDLSEVLQYLKAHSVTPADLLQHLRRHPLSASSSSVGESASNSDTTPSSSWKSFDDVNLNHITASGDDRGYHKIVLLPGQRTYSSPGPVLPDGTLYIQKLHRRNCYSFITDKDSLTLSNTRIKLPSPDSAVVLEPEKNLEKLFSSKLSSSSSVSQRYIIAEAHTSEQRKALGLPEHQLKSTRTLLSTVTHYPGIHTPYAYFASEGGSYFGLHVEDFYLPSANYHHAGYPKLWLIVYPRCMLALEREIKKIMSKNMISSCSQFTRHLAMILSPSQLRKWGIEFTVEIQPPGSLLIIEPYAYHQGLSLGWSVGEAVNLAYNNERWDPLPYYSECHCGHKNPDGMTLAGIKVKCETTRTTKRQDLGGDSQLRSKRQRLESCPARKASLKHSSKPKTHKIPTSGSTTKANSTSFDTDVQRNKQGPRRHQVEDLEVATSHNGTTSHQIGTSTHGRNRPRSKNTTSGCLTSTSFQSKVTYCPPTCEDQEESEDEEPEAELAPPAIEVQDDFYRNRDFVIIKQTAAEANRKASQQISKSLIQDNDASSHRCAKFLEGSTNADTWSQTRKQFNKIANASDGDSKSSHDRLEFPDWCPSDLAEYCQSLYQNSQVHSKKSTRKQIALAIYLASPAVFVDLGELLRKKEEPALNLTSPKDIKSAIEQYDLAEAEESVCLIRRYLAAIKLFKECKANESAIVWRPTGTRQTRRSPRADAIRKMMMDIGISHEDDPTKAIRQKLHRIINDGKRWADFEIRYGQVLFAVPRKSAMICGEFIKPYNYSLVLKQDDKVFQAVLDRRKFTQIDFSAIMDICRGEKFDCPLKSTPRQDVLAFGLDDPYFSRCLKKETVVA